MDIRLYRTILQTTWNILSTFLKHNHCYNLHACISVGDGDVDDHQNSDGSRPIDIPLNVRVPDVSHGAMAIATPPRFYATNSAMISQSSALMSSPQYSPNRGSLMAPRYNSPQVRWSPTHTQHSPVTSSARNPGKPWYICFIYVLTFPIPLSH